MDRRDNPKNAFPFDRREHINHAEPDQSLSIEQILKNVATTGVTGLPRPIEAVYDSEDNEDFDDCTIQPEFDNLDALDALESHRRNARSLKKQIEAEKAHQEALKKENALKEKEELKRLRELEQKTRKKEKTDPE